MNTYLINYETEYKTDYIESVKADNPYDAVAIIGRRRGYAKLAPIDIISIITNDELIFDRYETRTRNSNNK